MIWTTTPWTLPHNRALAFHPDYDYVVAETARGSAAAGRGPGRSGARCAEAGSLRVVRRAVEGQRFDGAEIQASVPGSEVSRRCWPITSRSIRAPASCTRRRATAWRTFRPGRNMASRRTRRIDGHGRYLEGLPEYKGKTVFEANPIVVDAAARSRGAAWRTETFAQLSALLALPQSGDFPRHRAMVHRFGRRRDAARARSGRARSRKSPK